VSGLQDAGKPANVRRSRNVLKHFGIFAAGGSTLHTSAETVSALASVNLWLSEV